MFTSQDDFVRNCWYVAGWSSEFAGPGPFGREFLGEAIVFYRGSNGQLRAFEDRCAHRHAPLSLGRVEGDQLRCLYHGMLFGTDGKCVEVPGQDIVPPAACVSTYPLVEHGGWAWIWMGEPAAADPAMIPQSIGFDEDRWTLLTGHLDYDAPANLINDNLLDLSHLSYVHANSFGATSGWTNKQPATTKIDRGVRVDRWVLDTPPIPPLPSLRGYSSVDMWATYEFIVPGVFLMYTALHPPGTAERLEHGEPKIEDALFDNFTLQAVTPITTEQSRYFFSWGPGTRFGGADIAQQMLDVACMAFQEDKIMIEAQYRIMKKAPERRIVPIAADRTPILFQRMMDKMRRHSGPENDALSGATST
nr:aromatic ring-hydroxylating dioxygenase subunit alpha [Sphingomonas bacterium]